MTQEEVKEAVNYLQTNTPLKEKYKGNDNYGIPKQEYLTKLVQLADDQLSKECEQFIWLSAYANNNPRSDYHWKCDVCYDECQRRNHLEIYSNAYKSVTGSL
ncbi:hypothetical protein M0P65_07900 [Candidatus Gracilibacteria bacterium]|jgi:hypothetical protein|nr:hypothetical protein [Candidatus Gracilibacteria bacterium]